MGGGVPKGSSHPGPRAGLGLEVAEASLAGRGRDLQSFGVDMSPY